jgi:hypothetical protein
MPLDPSIVPSPSSVSKLSQNLAVQPEENHALDAENDSEAETLIVSPVKKRDMLKQSASMQTLENTDEVPEKTPNPPAEKHVYTAREASIDTGRTNGDKPQEKEERPVDPDIKPEDQPTHNSRLNQDSDSDNLSDVSSVQSFEDEDAHGNGNGNDANNQDDDEDDGRPWASDKGAEDRTSNSRKRKLADVDQPRRKRRSSQDKLDRSSSPKLRRHRRTASAQSARPSQSRSNSGQHVHTAGVARQRRAATHFPGRETTLSRNIWDSDTSSETSHQYPKSRLTRNTSRAVSTPGRPMGLAKRHVNKYGFTRLAEACENGELESVKEWRQKDPEQLEQREFAGNTPLQVASLNGYPEIVSYLLEQGCNPHCANADKDTPLIDAVENGHLDVVQILLKADINPLHCNLKGQQALDVITSETENADEIRNVLREAIEDWNKNGKSEQLSNVEEPSSRPGPKQGLQFLARTYENLLKLVSDNDRSGVQEFLDARVPVDNNVVAAAAKTGDLYLVNMLLAEMTPKKARQRADRPMLSVIGTSHFEMVKALTELEQFDARWRSKSSNLTWYQIAESKQGPRWRDEKALLQKLYENKSSAPKPSSSPVARREPTKKRRRSVQRQDDSDVDMEDADSPERARSRRRLVSKKEMRTASGQRSSSELSDVAPPRRHAERGQSDQNLLKPPGPRKVGRPRKHSNSHLSEPQPKRQRSSSMLGPTEGDDAKNEAEGVAQHKGDEDIKMEEPDREAAAAEATRKADLDAKADAQKLADKLRRDEQTRKEEEAARRKEAERKAEEIRQQYERKQAEDRRLDWERKVQALPSALSHIICLKDVAGKERQTYIQRHFLPVQVVKRVDLGQAGEEGNPDDLWMLNYQAAAILTGKDTNALLNLPVDPKIKPSSLTGATTFEVTVEQRRLMLACLQSTTLVHGLASSEDSEADGPGNLLAELAEADKIQQRIKEDRTKFLDMEALRWMRFSDFYKIATSAECVYLAGLDIQMRFDCCLDPFSFSTDVKSINNSTDDTDNERVNGTTNGTTHEEGLSAAGPGVTTIMVVQD